MIEFTLNRNKNGKKSRWAKKYPRKRILKKEAVRKLLDGIFTIGMMRVITISTEICINSC